MPKYPKREFAEMCGMKTGNLTNYIKRGKVIEKDGEIDGNEPINAQFLESRQAKKTKASSNPQPQKKSSNPGIQKNLLDEIEVTETNKKFATLQNQKAKADLDKKLIDTKTARLNYQILKGKHIPTDMVRDVISELGRSILTNYKDSAESFLTEFSHRAALTPEQHAEMKGILINEINQAHTKAIEATKKQVAAIVADFKKENKTELDELDGK